MKPPTQEQTPAGPAIERASDLPVTEYSPRELALMGITATGTPYKILQFNPDAAPIPFFELGSLVPDADLAERRRLVLQGMRFRCCAQCGNYLDVAEVEERCCSYCRLSLPEFGAPELPPGNDFFLGLFEYSGVDLPEALMQLLEFEATRFLWDTIAYARDHHPMIAPHYLRPDDPRFERDAGFDLGGPEKAIQGARHRLRVQGAERVSEVTRTLVVTALKDSIEMLIGIGEHRVWGALVVTYHAHCAWLLRWTASGRIPEELKHDPEVRFLRQRLHEVFLLCKRLPLLSEVAWLLGGATSHKAKSKVWLKFLRQ